jgi:CBS domain-containing protein
MTEREVMLRLATYNLLSVAVVDAGNHLLGAITVDDVLDRALPGDWRRAQISPSVAHHPASHIHDQHSARSTP